MVQPEVVPPPPAWSDLLRPGLFSLLFTGGSLGGCAIWQYESMGQELDISLSKLTPTLIILMFNIVFQI